MTFAAGIRRSGDQRPEETMTKLVLDLTISLDGFVAGPNATLEKPIGDGGERLHEWLFATASWSDAHGAGTGEAGQDSDVYAEVTEATGAVVMGRKMFSGGEGLWEDDPNGRGWWGDDPPFHKPVFVLTHHARDPLPLDGGTTFTFVTDGPAAALEQARGAAGGKDVLLAGGAEAASAFLKAGLLDVVQIHVVPQLLGDGVRLFDGVGPEDAGFELDRVISSPTVTHLRYRVTGGRR
jgi:dihydrofolate reductase